MLIYTPASHPAQSKHWAFVCDHLDKVKDDDDASGMSSKRYRIIFILIFMLMSGAFSETTKQHMTNDMENAQSGKCFHRNARLQWPSLSTFRSAVTSRLRTRPFCASFSIFISLLAVCLRPSHSAAVRHASLPNDNDFALNSTRLSFSFWSSCPFLATLNVRWKFDKNLQEKWVSADANDLEDAIKPNRWHNQVDFRASYPLSSPGDSDEEKRMTTFAFFVESGFQAWNFREMGF